MNPQSPKPNHPASNLVHDIAAPPKTTATDLIKPEIEHGIPVKQQSHTASTPNPIVAPKQVTDSPEQGDAELDHILKDVNRGVKEADEKPAPSKEVKAKDQKQKPTAQAKKRNSKPIVITAVAVFVACGLGTAAVYAFKEGGSPAAQQQSPGADGKVGTSVSASNSVQAAGGSLVTPSDLSDLSSSLKSELDQLNDSEEFNSKDLEDQTLGL